MRSSQKPEIESELTPRWIPLLPIMVDPAPMVAAEAARFGIDTPILIHPGAEVSQSYDMVGVYGHAHRPSHCFAVIRQDGSVGWVHHCAEMFVPPTTSWPGSTAFSANDGHVGRSATN